MATPHWRQLGFLTPDAMECQQDVWALQARLRAHLADALAELSARTAEPTWGASLRDATDRARALGAELAEEAGEDAVVRVGDDELVQAFEGPLAEVLASGHVPSLLTTGYVTLGELGVLPVRLLDEVAGDHARMLCGRITGADDHALLGRLLGVVQPARPELEHLRRLLRHLNRGLFEVYQSWRQTFHTLGVDGEWLAEEAATTVTRAHESVGLKATRADLAVFRAG